MRQDSERFGWAVASDGYKWVEAFNVNDDFGRHESEEPERHTYLTDGQPVGVRSSTARLYRPLIEHSGLFRIFASSQPTLEGAKAFADRFGLLGGDDVSDLIYLERAGQQTVLAGERPGPWLDQILTMNRLVELWDMIRLNDLAGLERVINWKEPDCVVYERMRPDAPERLDSFHLIASPAHNAHLLSTFQKSDLVGPALCHLQLELNRRMSTHLSPFLVADRESSDLKVTLVPTSLSAAIWLQFAISIERGSDFRPCAQCGDWFEVVRKGKEFCSNRCRTRAHRSRKAEA